MSERAPQAEDHIQAFREAMAAEGIRYSGPIEADSKFHRVNGDDDRKGDRNVWYILHLDDRPAGGFGWNKLGNETKFSWSAKGLKPLTDAERAEMKRKAAAAKAQAAAEEAERQGAARLRAETLWAGAVPATTHPYLDRKKVQAHGLRVGPWIKLRKDGSPVTVHKNALLIPMVAAKDEIWALQAVFPDKVELMGELRDKDFIGGARKKGLYHPIGRPGEVEGRMLIGFAEGYATAAAVHQATGLGVMTCFDAGNLVHVARIFREKFPAARLVFFADNDQFTEIRGVPTNVGVLKATDAAETVKGEVIAPWFTREDIEADGKPTDWNDLLVLRGEDEVRAQIMRRVVAPPPWVEDEDPFAGETSCGTHLVTSDEPPLPESAEAYGGGGELAPEAPAAADEAPKKKRAKRTDDDGAIGNPEAIKKNGNFTILGHDRDTIYIFQHEKKMIVARPETAWSDAAFITLAPPDWWENNFGVKGKFDKNMAINAIVRHAYAKGYYDPNTVRGRGAWMDDGRLVLHLGNKLLVNGEDFDVTEIDSAYVYEQAARLRAPADDPMSAQDGKRIIETAKVFHWTRPASAILLAGWIALAPLCGALRWRPHLWITGGAGAGKSTILNDYLKALLHGMEVYAQGNSTEAGIRQTLGCDALPVMFDESEQNDDRERLRVQAILALARQASTESAAKTLKGTQMGDAQGFMVRSMFCLSSIQVGMKHQADMERISVLALRPKRTANKDQAAKNWAVIKKAVDELAADTGLSGRLLRRSIQLLPTTRENIEVFSRAAADKFGSQRDGDQYGTLLAGAWSLISTQVATEEQARQMIGRYDWAEYTETTEQEESSKALQTLLERQIRTNRGDVSVYELVARCAGREGDGAWDGAKEAADNILRRHGMMIKWSTSKKVETSALLVANNHSELDRLMEGTPYAADVKGQLIRVPGSFRHTPERFNGTCSRSVGIPLGRILDGDEALPDQFGDDIEEF